jgi:hypothetical protein
MLKFLTRAEKVEADGVISAESADAFWRSLPHQDPIDSQRAICDALASIRGPRGPELNRLRALLALERRSEPLVENLLSEYVSPNSVAQDREVKLRQSIAELVRSFALAYEYFLRHLRADNPGTEWHAHAPAVLVHLFRHREIDLLLSLYRFESWPRGRWKDLFGAYEFAATHAFARQPVEIDFRDGKATQSVTLEQALIRVLLLQLTGDGRFLPFDIAVAREEIARWSDRLSLETVDDDGRGAQSTGFVVDLSGYRPLRRPSSVDSGTGLRRRLDTTPIALAVERDVATVRNAPAETGAEALLRARRLALLGKLGNLFAAKPPRIKRRGERMKMESVSVQAIIGGLPSIGRMLRSESRRIADADQRTSPYVDEITINDVPEYGGTSSAVVRDAAAGILPIAGVDAMQPLWQVHDRSESGCLLRGQTLDTRHSLPGSLMALREHDAPWTIGVVRRLNRPACAAVELGVEHIGRNPQRVMMMGAATANGKRPKFVALYLPESDAYPRIPIKTLIIPAHEYSPARVLTLVSTTSETAIRLKDPIESQRDFVWTSFDLVERERRR